ncbi:MAG: diaminopropionate ammonia-lyase [Lachnospiraceae bacterium]|nr:diaminopropionate ammonia-lyase [Lachnospiraceae bacterium]
MKEYRAADLRFMRQEPVFNDVCLSFSEEAAQDALRFHRTLPGYRETPLLSLSAAAARCGVDEIFVKDESGRFGLKAFKGLGGSYAMFRILCKQLSLDPRRTVFADFQEPDIRRRCAEITFVTATDGNHGKGVSWAAKLFGCQAHVFMPKGSVEARRRAIEEAGCADARITEFNYDQTVAYCDELARENGWILIQDTAWEGYEQIPAHIIEGYLTLAAEAARQMGGKRPTHLFLQAGVGAMAGGIESYFVSRSPAAPPFVTIAEPETAACVYRSAAAGDGKIHSVGGNPETIMAGLNCGTPCGIVWPVLRDCSAFFCACSDEIARDGMRAYARPEGSDPAVVSGESGAVTYGLVRRILASEDLRARFGIGPDSVILLVNTEGDTDPENYAAIVNGSVL